MVTLDGQFADEGENRVWADDTKAQTIDSSFKRQEYICKRPR